MAKRDYYDLLGINKSASGAEIKSAYRRLARKYHPDIDKSAGAAERFKEVSEAYQVLSDAQKKKTYDQFGHAAFEGGRPFGGAQGGFGSPFGGFGYSWSTSPEGFVDPFDLFEQIFGMGGFGSEFARGFRRRQVYQMDLNFEEAVHGAAKEVEIQRVEGNHNRVERERMTIKVPAGVEDGTRMRFGDVDIIFRVRPHPEFIREGADIFNEAAVTIPQAVLGCVLEVNTIHGRIRLKVPSGTQPGSLVKLKGKGAPTLRGGTGDHYVRIRIEVPKNISGKEKELYGELASLKDKKKSWF